MDKESMETLVLDVVKRRITSMEVLRLEVESYLTANNKMGDDNVKAEHVEEHINNVLEAGGLYLVLSLIDEELDWCNLNSDIGLFKELYTAANTSVQKSLNGLVS